MNKLIEKPTTYKAKAKRVERIARAILVYLLTAVWATCLATRAPSLAHECCSLPSLAQIGGGP